MIGDDEKTNDDVQLGFWYIYCFRVGKRFKIGRTSDVYTRRRTLKADDQIFCIEVAGVDEAIVREREVLQAFSAWRDTSTKETEWFFLTKEIVTTVLGSEFWRPISDGVVPAFRANPLETDWDQLARIDWDRAPVSETILGPPHTPVAEIIGSPE